MMDHKLKTAYFSSLYGKYNNIELAIGFRYIKKVPEYNLNALSIHYINENKSISND